MLRKTIFLVPAFALALLAVNRVGGLAGKIGADGLAWAQDSSPADDGAQNDSGDLATAQITPDKTSSTKFKGSGTIAGTPYGCSYEECLSTTGTVTKISIKAAGTGTVTGDATFDNCKENKATKKTCCTFASSVTYSFSSGDLDATFGGVACDNGKNTKATVTNAPFEITGGTGSFSAASGSGKGNITYDPKTNKGTFKFSGKGTGL